MKYLLSNGESTNKMEIYLLDLFKIYLLIHPNDIPHSDIGFDFNLSNVKKDELADELKDRVNNLVKLFKSQFKEFQITVKEISLIDEQRAKIIIDINNNSQVYEISTRLY